jgi:hypothetical protein
MSEKKAIAVGGWCFIAFILIVVGLRIILRLSYNYPTIMYADPHTAFTALLAGGLPLRVLLTLYSVVPLLLLPASIGAYYALRNQSEPGMRLSLLFALLFVFSLMLTLMEVPSFDWVLAGFYLKADPSQQTLVTAMMSGIASYFSFFTGEFIAKICGIVWFYTIGINALRNSEFPKWLGYLGIFASIYLIFTFIGNFNLFPIGVKKVIQLFLPIEAIWLFTLGVFLTMYKSNQPDYR